MPGLTLSNEFIARDEALHTEFAVLLHPIIIVVRINAKSMFFFIF